MQLTLYPGFKSPDPAKFNRPEYVKYIQEKLPTEMPAMFGLHPNAEIGYLTNLGETIFNTIIKVTGGGGGGGAGAQEAIVAQIQNFLKDLPEDFNMIEIQGRIPELTPYMIVSIQEVERMNILLGTLRLSLIELDQGLKGALNITEAMETLQNELTINKVPGSWALFAYPSNKKLLPWFQDLL
jgi:dynein heavy chain